MSSLSLKLKVEELRGLAYGDITDEYIEIGDNYENAVRIYHLQNLTDVNIAWSWDGDTDNGILAAGGFLLLDVTANKTRDDGQYLPKGGNTWIRSFTGSDATSGSVVLTLFYGA